RVPGQASLHTELLPAPRSDRALVGIDASIRHPQSLLRDLQRVLPIHSEFPAPRGTEKLGDPLRFRHRQLPRHQSCRFSGSQGITVYVKFKFFFPAFVSNTSAPKGSGSLTEMRTD